MINAKFIGAAVAVVLALAVMVMGEPSLDDQVKKQSREIDEVLASRAVHVDPAELLDAIHNNNMAVKILDLRDETDYNLFHIQDSTFVTMDLVRDPMWVKELPKETAIMLVGNDEALATEAWKLLKVQKVSNIYILEGGLNNWLARYGGFKLKPEAERKAGGLDYFIGLALGGNHPASDPDPEHAPKHEYAKKIKSIGKKNAKKLGGCG
jgi:hypothetical protein